MVRLFLTSGHPIENYMNNVEFEVKVLVTLQTQIKSMSGTE